MKDREADTWTPPIEVQLSDINPASTKRDCWYLLKSGLLIGLVLNAVAVLLAARFLNTPRGSAIDIDPLFPPLMLTLVAGLVVGVPLAIIHMVVSIKKKRGAVMVAVGIVALVLNLGVGWVNNEAFLYVIQSRSLHSAESCCSQ